MGKVPATIIQHIYEYDSTYKDIFGKVLISLQVHCFIYRCDQCCRHYNGCYCFFCKTCRSFLRFCRQLYFDENSMTEDDIYDIVPMTNYFCSKYSALYYIRWTTQL